VSRQSPTFPDGPAVAPGDVPPGPSEQPLRLPKAVAAAGAWVQGRLEPVVPDAIDDGEQPFIRPFMVKMADDRLRLRGLHQAWARGLGDRSAARSGRAAGLEL